MGNGCRRCSVAPWHGRIALMPRSEPSSRPRCDLETEENGAEMTKKKLRWKLAPGGDLMPLLCIHATVVPQLSLLLLASFVIHWPGSTARCVQYDG